MENMYDLLTSTQFDFGPRLKRGCWHLPYTIISQTGTVKPSVHLCDHCNTSRLSSLQFCSQSQANTTTSANKDSCNVLCDVVGRAILRVVLSVVGCILSVLPSGSGKGFDSVTTTGTVRVAKEMVRPVMAVSPVNHHSKKSHKVVLIISTTTST